jgi:hypothetical protein
MDSLNVKVSNLDLMLVLFRSEMLAVYKVMVYVLVLFLLHCIVLHFFAEFVRMMMNH